MFGRCVHRFTEIRSLYFHISGVPIVVYNKRCMIKSNLLQLCSMRFDVTARRIFALIDFKWTLFAITILTQCYELVNACTKSFLVDLIQELNK